jgi:ABC-2 type transport system permease protein
VKAVLTAQLRERRSSLITWGLSVGVWSAFIVAIYPSVASSLTSAIRGYPEPFKKAFGISDLSTVAQYLHAEMLSLIVPLAIGYLAARSVASGLSGASESGRLEVVLSAPLSRIRLVAGVFLASAVEIAGVLVIALALAELGSVISGAGLPLGSATAGYANVWPLALMSAALAIVVTGRSLRTSIVTGSVAGVLVAMYVIDLAGRLDTSLDAVRYGSVFRYYGKAAENGLDPLAFLGVTGSALALAAIGAHMFARRDL